eukprot:426659-Pleurochrysis_carterae.AAC.1
MAALPAPPVGGMNAMCLGSLRSAGVIPQAPTRGWRSEQPDTATNFSFSYSGDLWQLHLMRTAQNRVARR